MPSKPTVTTISALTVILCGGCERDREQPWRKALDEGKVIRLGGTIGKLSPTPAPTEAPLFPPPVVVQPSATGAPTVKKVPVEDLPIPAPPKAVEKKTAAPENGEEPKLGPPR
jgi:hypothetical protein